MMRHFNINVIIQIVLIIFFIVLITFPQYNCKGVESNELIIPNISEVIINSFKGIYYVDGDGSGDFTKIQEAIDNVSDGDTIIVRSGIYHENVIVDKSIFLFGENKTTTIINADGKNDVVYISANYVNVVGFTIINSGNNYGSPDAGIEVRSDFTIIFNNIIKNNLIGLYFYDSSNNNISGNTIINNNKGGIRISEYTYNNIIFENIISNNKYDGIALVGFKNNHKHRILKNSISNNSNGIYFAGSSENIILNNFIEDNLYVGINVGGISENNVVSWNNIYNNNLRGIYLEDCFNTKILFNNFIGNGANALFGWCHFDNQWDFNYWEKSRLFPKLIFGTVVILFPNSEIIIPWINFDWHPAQKPNIIS